MSVPEAPLEDAGDGLVPVRDGWFVLNAREARWLHRDGRGERLRFEGEMPFPQIGVSVYVLAPGEPIGMYHWEADQEDFLVLRGEAVLIIEGEERSLTQWDFVHCPAYTPHMIVGSGEVPCVVLAIGAREHQEGPGWGGYVVDDAALRHHAGVEQETNDPAKAYARFQAPEWTRYRDGWLP
jgi:uncharacterized cupin superfamily protein